MKVLVQCSTRKIIAAHWETFTADESRPVASALTGIVRMHQMTTLYLQVDLV